MGANNSATIDIGHAAWGVGVSQNELSNIDSDLKDFANKAWGFHETSIFIYNLYNAAVNTPSHGNFTVQSPGILDNAGTGSERKRFVLETKQNAESALQYIRAIKNTPPNYVIPDHNCADECLTALQNAGLPAPNCKFKTKFNFYGTRPHREWNVELSDPQKLAEELAK